MLTKAYIDCIKDRLRSSWVQGHFAVTASGETCIVADPDAVKFCMMGAAWICGPKEELQSASGTKLEDRQLFQANQFRTLFTQTHKVEPIVFNDTLGRKVDEILEALDALPVEVS